jgi:general secretion pathway protein E
LRGINQIQVKPSIGLTFANSCGPLSAGPMSFSSARFEMENREIAIHSALTGHLVLSTLHTNDAPSAITRLIDMGVEDYLLSSTIAGILAQRLVRVACPNCSEPYTPDPAIMNEMKLSESDLKNLKISRVKDVGCSLDTGAAWASLNF